MYALFLCANSTKWFNWHPLLFLACLSNVKETRLDIWGKFASKTCESEWNWRSNLQNSSSDFISRQNRSSMTLLCEAWKKNLSPPPQTFFAVVYIPDRKWKVKKKKCSKKDRLHALRGNRRRCVSAFVGLLCLYCATPTERSEVRSRYTRAESDTCLVLFSSSSHTLEWLPFLKGSEGVGRLKPQNSHNIHAVQQALYNPRWRC